MLGNGIRSVCKSTADHQKNDSSSSTESDFSKQRKFAMFNLRLRETWETILKPDEEITAKDPEQFLYFVDEADGQPPCPPVSPFFDEDFLRRALMLDSPASSSISSMEASAISEPFTPLDTLLPLFNPSNNIIPGASCSHSVDVFTEVMPDGFAPPSFFSPSAPPPTPSVEEPETSHLLSNTFQRADQAHLWLTLQSILSSEWYANDQPEPNDERGRSIYHHFLSPTAEPSSYTCLFDGCLSVQDRQDRALGHIRSHLDHRPFACGGTCKNMGCEERFYCPSYLRTHVSRKKIQCSNCKATMFPQNLRRHLKTCRGAAVKRRSTR